MSALTLVPVLVLPLLLVLQKLEHWAHDGSPRDSGERAVGPVSPRLPAGQPGRSR